LQLIERKKRVDDSERRKREKKERKRRQDKKCNAFSAKKVQILAYVHALK